jgi:crossover junction endodeoxyribonuclease RusA
MTLELPWPPALNRYYRNLNGRTLISQAGRDYRINAYLAVCDQAPGHVGGRVRVDITAHQPDRRRRDLDGMLKAVLDALTHTNVIDDDSCIDDLRIKRGDLDRKRPRLVLTVEPL